MTVPTESTERGRFRRRVRYARPRRSVRRRIAVATWRPSRDGRIYTRVEVDAAPLLAYLEQTRQRTGERITITHVIGAAVGRGLREVPEIRARIVLGRLVELSSCDIGFAVDINEGQDLAPVKLAAVDTMSPVDVARGLAEGAARLRAGRDRAHRRSTGLARLAPTWALQALMPVTGFVVGGLGRPAFGQPGFPLGTAFISNVGSLGLDEAYLAPLPFARVPLYLAIGAVREVPVAVDGRVVVRPQVVLVATADHRIVDGAHAGRLTTVIRGLLADPAQLDHPN